MMKVSSMTLYRAMEVKATMGKNSAVDVGPSRRTTSARLWSGARGCRREVVDAGLLCPLSRVMPGSFDLVPLAGVAGEVKSGELGEERSGVGNGWLGGHLFLKLCSTT